MRRKKLHVGQCRHEEVSSLIRYQEVLQIWPKEKNSRVKRFHDSVEARCDIMKLIESVKEVIFSKIIL
jgi:hypothetical protein